MALRPLKPHFGLRRCDVIVVAPKTEKKEAPKAETKEAPKAKKPAPKRKK